jgi:preprotein translocase subunit SecE
VSPLFEYLSASRAELAKVAWPSRRQTARLTFVVIVFSLIIAAVIGTLDYLFSLGLQKLIS